MNLGEIKKNIQNRFKEFAEKNIQNNYSHVLHIYLVQNGHKFQMWIYEKNNSVKVFYSSLQGEPQIICDLDSGWLQEGVFLGVERGLSDINFNAAGHYEIYKQILDIGSFSDRIC